MGHPIGTLAESALATGTELKQTGNLDTPSSRPRNKVAAARIKKTTPKSQKAHCRAGATVFLAIMENSGRSNSLSLSWRDSKYGFLSQNLQMNLHGGQSKEDAALEAMKKFDRLNVSLFSIALLLSPTHALQGH